MTKLHFRHGFANIEKQGRSSVENYIRNCPYRDSPGPSINHYPELLEPDFEGNPRATLCVMGIKLRAESGHFTL
jgi:hypothetical protein